MPEDGRDDIDRAGRSDRHRGGSNGPEQVWRYGQATRTACSLPNYVCEGLLSAGRAVLRDPERIAGTSVPPSPGPQQDGAMLDHIPHQCLRELRYRDGLVGTASLGLGGGKLQHYLGPLDDHVSPNLE